MKSNKNTMWKDTFNLFLITLVAGCLLGLVYEVTKEPIALAKYNKKQEAYSAVYSDAVSFEENADLAAAVETSESFFADAGITGVYMAEALEAKDGSGETIGYVMNFGSNEGYGGTIDLSCGVAKDGTLTGVSVLTMSETAGLGAKCTDKEFQEQFTGIKAEEIVYTKTGKSADNEIDAISGATITTTAVTKAVNGAVAFIRSNGEISE